MADEQREQDELDPELIARLEAWFGSPTTAVAPAPPPPAPQQSESEFAHARLRRQALAAVNGGALMEAIEALGRARATVIEPLPPIELRAERSATRFDLARWRLLKVEPGEAERPDDLWDALAEQAPQALLRDLHRPVFYFDDVELEPLEVIPAGARDPSSQIREVLGTDYRWRPEAPMLALAADDLRALRRRLRHEPWADAPGEIARARAAREAPAPEREPTTEELIALFEPPR